MRTTQKKLLGLLVAISHNVPLAWRSFFYCAKPKLCEVASDCFYGVCFCFVRLVQLFDFCFYTLKKQLNSKAKSNVLQVRWVQKL
jgi:hypothetical protein